jgi:hypothetical protein
MVSFDIDGTMVFGDPPGPVTLAMVVEAKRRGHVVGSASDRTLGEQRAMWRTAGIDVAFVSRKHVLSETRSRFSCARFVHIGDTMIDEHYARLAGFEFFGVDVLPEPGVPGWVY